jgi:hypothetical protein
MSQAQQLEALIKRLEAVASRLESGATGSKAESGGAKEEPQVSAYDEYVATFVAPFLATCRDIGGDLNGLVCVSICILTRRLIWLKKVSKKAKILLSWLPSPRNPAMLILATT